MFGEDIEREQFFETARRQAQQDFEQDQTNAQALVRWGGALLELAHYRQGDEANRLIKDAIGKFNEALGIDAARTDAEWCLGNAYTSLGFLSPDRESALEHFQKAQTVFQSCQVKEPNNETYRKALEMCNKAPEYYDEIQEQISRAAAGGPSSRGEAGGKKSSDPNEFWWDVAGWVVLATIIVGAVAVARSSSGAKA
eukprot:jgi/Chrzof1/10992/Cz05g19250.t1